MMCGSAKVEFAIALFNGDGIQKDEARAAALFRQAALHGNPVAQNRLARILAVGRGVAKDPIEAGAWHILARSNSVPDPWLDQLLNELPAAERAAAERRAQAWREGQAAPRT